MRGREASTRISPFTEVIKNGLVDPNVRVTRLECFDGTLDPQDHMGYYEILM